METGLAHHVRHIEELGRCQRFERIADKGVASTAIDKLPTWAQIILMVLGIITCVYGIAHYGWSFILRMIFSPDL
jgi:hypothetical protein